MAKTKEQKIAEAAERRAKREAAAAAPPVDPLPEPPEPPAEQQGLPSPPEVATGPVNGEPDPKVEALIDEQQAELDEAKEDAIPVDDEHYGEGANLPAAGEAGPSVPGIAVGPTGDQTVDPKVEEDLRQKQKAIDEQRDAPLHDPGQESVADYVKRLKQQHPEADIPRNEAGELARRKLDAEAKMRKNDFGVRYRGIAVGPIPEGW